MSRIAQERETTITFNDEESDALIWSASTTFQRRMAKLNIEPFRVTEDSSYYKVPKKYVKVSRPRKMQQLSNEQRKAIGRRLHKNEK